jgi:anti-sigma factor RsiW
MFEPKPHDGAEELLPWYATGQLDSGERARVEHHLLSCAACRTQLTFERRIMQEFRTLAPDLDSGWARMRSRVAPRSVRRPSVVWTDKLADAAKTFWRGLGRPVVPGLIAAQAAFALMAFLFAGWLYQPAYHTLSSAPAPSSANVIIMFRADAHVRDLDGELRGVGATIVGGPTPAGAFLLHVESRQRSSALSSLRSNPSVQMAEQIDGQGR